MRRTLPALILLTALVACGQAPTPTALQTPRLTAASAAPLVGPAVVGWGNGMAGQLYVFDDVGVPRAVAATRDRTVYVTEDGRVEVTGQSVPVPAGLANVASVAAAQTHTAALRQDGTVVSWSETGDAALDTPSGLSGVTAIAAGGGGDSAFTLALRRDGTVAAWGHNTLGQLDVPAGLTGVTAVAAGYGFGAALRDDGTVVTWGNNDFGQRNVPAGLTGVVALSAQGAHAVALRADGTVAEWGTTGQGVPRPAQLSGVVAVAAGQNFTVALLGDGHVVGWGADDWGQATGGAGVSDAVALVAGYDHALALRALTPAPLTVPETPADTTPPEIAVTTDPVGPDGAAGWFRTPVTVTWTASDAGSPVSTAGCGAVTVDDTRATTLTCTATSAGGQTTRSVTLHVDTQRPSLTPTLSQDGPVTIGTRLVATPNATDATSGVASAACAVPDTSVAGTFSVTCTATDVAGHTVSVGVPYTVSAPTPPPPAPTTFPFRGFLAPVDALPVVNAVKAGSAVPVKFSLGGNRGLNILAGAPRVTPYACGAAPQDSIETLVAGSTSGLQYDAASDVYTYVWKTDRKLSGCVMLDVMLSDGTHHRAAFRLK